MAPTDAEIRSQTDQIVYFLLAGEDEAQKRMFTGEIVPDGPGKCLICGPKASPAPAAEWRCPIQICGHRVFASSFR